MNAQIETLFTGFTVGGVVIPVQYMFYSDKHGEPYVIYRQYDNDNSYGAEDEIGGYVCYYDFDIYAKGNYKAIAAAVTEKLKGADWTPQPRRDSPDMYEADSQYFHKTLCFAYPIQTNYEEVLTNEQQDN